MNIQKEEINDENETYVNSVFIGGILAKDTSQDIKKGTIDDKIVRELKNHIDLLDWNDAHIAGMISKCNSSTYYWNKNEPLRPKHISDVTWH